MEPRVSTLPNGLRIVIVDTKSFPTVTTQLLVGAGSRYETKDNNGIAHFFEHMAFKGSKKYPSSFIISSAIEGEGGIFNAFTAKDHTGYWIKSLSEDFPTVIDLLSDMILNPLLLTEEIEREKGVIAEEINMYEDTPYRKVGELYDSLLYHGNGLGFEIAGKKSTVVNFSHQTFSDYIGQLYHPQNAVLVIAGGIKYIKDLDKLIVEKFGQWNGKTAIQFTPVKENQKKPALTIKYKKTEQAHFCLGYRAFSFKDPRRFTLSILSTILGGGMSSRLFTEVREKRGLCYYISTGRELYHDVGNITTQAGVTNKAEKVMEAIEVIIEEHKKISLGSVTEEEVNKAKELIKGRIMLSMEDSSNVASYFGTKLLLEDKITTPQETIANIEKVTLEQVVNLAEEYFKPERLNIAVIGPFRKLDLNLAERI